MVLPASRSHVRPVILCGGSGTRLWPKSREAFPKQFAPIIGERSTFQETLLRVKEGGVFGRPLIVTSKLHRFMVERQMAEVGITGDILLEPMPRDSGPAIVAASLYLAEHSPEALALVLAAALPLGAGLMYVRLGAPALPAKPYAARQQDPEIMMAAAMGRLVEQLDHKPDAEGYRHLATLGFMLRRYDQAAEAYRKLIALQGADAALWSKLGEALVLANEGQVVPEAREAFAETLRRDPQEARARFYTGLAAAQDAAPDRALALWRELERDSPADSPWLPMLKAHIALYAKPATVAP